MECAEQVALKKSKLSPEREEDWLGTNGFKLEGGVMRCWGDDAVTPGHTQAAHIGSTGVSSFWPCQVRGWPGLTR